MNSVTQSPAKQLPHSASLRKGRVSQCLGLYYITKCLRKNCEFSESQCLDVVNAFCYMRGKGLVLLYAFVVMPDHFHVLFSLPTSIKIGTVVAQLCRRASFPSRKNGISIEWQPEFHDRKVRVNESVVGIVRYIEQNPVRKDFVKSELDWRWSSANRKYSDVLDRHFLGSERWEERGFR